MRYANDMAARGRPRLEDRSKVKGAVIGVKVSLELGQQFGDAAIEDGFDKPGPWLRHLGEKRAKAQKRKKKPRKKSGS